ncbi:MULTISPECIES: hypothetical protein [unclassified Halorubrum]|uniref:hypothetical protein n=1 Tax=unclassified Halorubrum TaxID=2642239 RepID=UPI0018EE4D19|nr:MULTISPECIES: hypothetical protein [unclassified Halorubrum]
MSSVDPGDRIEKADTALAAVATEYIDAGDVEFAYIVATDMDAGEGIVSALSRKGFDGRVQLKNGFELIEEII